MLASHDLASATHAAAPPAGAISRAVAIAIVVVVEVFLVALFVLGWISAEPAADAPLAAPAPAGLSDSTNRLVLDTRGG